MEQFIAEAEKWLNEFDEVLRIYGQDTIEQNKILFRLSHNIKGSALTLQLSNTANMAIQAENFLRDFAENGKSELDGAQIVSLSEWSKHIRKVINGYQSGDIDEIAVKREITDFFSNKRHQGV
jgi:chemotaxis protein histidine kinase CheA